MAILSGAVSKQNIDYIFQGDYGREGFLNRYNNQLLETFELQPSYFPVFFRNSDYKTFDTVGVSAWVIDEKDNYDDKISRKKIIIKPPNELKIGEVMKIDSWSEITGSNQIWLVTELDPSPLYFSNGTVTKCNNILKFYDEFHNLIQEPCVFDFESSNGTFDYEPIIVVDKKIKSVLLQANDNTRKLAINQRLVFDGYAYKIIDIGKHNRFDLDKPSPLLDLMLEKDPIAPDDDLNLGIANINQYKYSLKINQNSFVSSVNTTSQLTYSLYLNNEATTQPIKWETSDNSKATIDSNGLVSFLSTGNVTISCSMINNPLIFDSITINITNSPIMNKTINISPNINYIYEGDSQIYNVKAYLNGVVTNDTFTINANGSNNSNYKLNIIDGNNFKIDNLKRSNSKLRISCSDNISGEIMNIDIILKGKY